MVRESNVRMIALASTIALALTLPLAAAIAGPSEPGEPSPGAKPSASSQSRGEAAGRTAGQAGELPPGTPRGSAQDAPLPGRHGPPQDGARHSTMAGNGAARNGDTSGALLRNLGLGRLSEDAGDGRTARCGPELSSPHGIRAQTCVVAEDGRTRGVLYYRNASGGPLRAVLTLMRPDGRTVQTHCALSAADEPGTCATPSGATVRGSAPYAAIAEIADVRSDQLLLRAGSNSAPPEADSAR
ncbi:hypothetical protein [Streptomyces ochraceiscleroticus]|uniref:Uncharacterized protein n=1 Tax=Streptomyces ochraceiscleroticus TaxID=47761 RepID=A0ABW1MM38_9ACTN|nr:hypothetical protein [Streptomyces ochraceiscleroticus]